MIGEQVVRSSLNTSNKRYKSSTSTAVTSYDLYLGLEEDYNSKVNMFGCLFFCVMQYFTLFDLLFSYK